MELRQVDAESARMACKMISVKSREVASSEVAYRVSCQYDHVKKPNLGGGEVKQSRNEPLQPLGNGVHGLPRQEDIPEQDKHDSGWRQSGCLLPGRSGGGGKWRSMISRNRRRCRNELMMGPAPTSNDSKRVWFKSSTASLREKQGGDDRAICSSFFHDEGTSGRVCR